MRILLIMLVLASIVQPFTLSAETINWTGANSTDWTDPTNWDCNCLPAEDDDVNLPSGSFVDLADDAEVRIRSLTIRGNLFIEDGSTLLIDSQGNQESVGLTLVLGSITNQGQVTISGVEGQAALLINTEAEFANTGGIRLEEVWCTSSDCMARDVIEVNGIFTNNGTLRVFGVYGMDGFIVRGSFTNAGTVQMDSIRTTGSAFGLSRTASFINMATANLNLLGISGENLTRAISNTQDSVTWQNAGLVQIEMWDDTSTGIRLSGEGTTVVNTGTINIRGGGVAVELGAPDRFSNQGQLNLFGQQERGLSLFGELVFQNEGEIQLQNGEATEGIVLSGTVPGPQLLNTGSIKLKGYLQASTFNRGLQALVGRVRNEGFIGMEGASDGSGLEIREEADPIENTEMGTIYLNHFDHGLRINEATTNAGTMILAKDLGEAILDDNVPLINTGTLAGGSIYREGVYELMPTSILSPGTDSTTARQSFGSDVLLAETVVIDLDLASTMEDPDAYDNIRSSRSFQFSGTVNVRLRDDFSLTSGSFDLLRGSGSAGGLIGDPIVNLPDSPMGSEWRIEQTETKLILHLDVINDIENGQEESISPTVFPNPVVQGELLTITIPGKDTIGKLFSVSGHIVKTQQLTTGSNSIETGDLPAGYYLLSIDGINSPLIIQ